MDSLWVCLYFHKAMTTDLMYCLEGQNKCITKSTHRAQTSLAEADHYSHMNPYVAKMVMNVEPLWWKANPKGSGSLPVPGSNHANMIVCSFTHLRRPRSPLKFNQFFIVPSRISQKISSKSIHLFLSNHKCCSQTDMQTDVQTNTSKTITSFCQGGNNFHHQVINYLSFLVCLIQDLQQLYVIFFCILS